MDISNKKVLFFLAILFLGALCCFNISLYSQGTKNISETENLEKVKALLNEGLEYLKLESFDRAKSKFEEALRIAPREMTVEIKSLIANTDNMLSKQKNRSAVTSETIAKSEEEAKKNAELQQKILQFEKEQKRITYMSQGNFYYDQGEYEKAIVEFNKVLAMDVQDKDAASSVEKANSAIKKAQEMQVKRIQDYWSNAKGFVNSKKYDSAIEETEKILAANPLDIAALEYIEEIKLRKAEFGEYKRLEAIVNKGKQYSREKEYDKAIQIWEQVLNEKENFPGVEVLIAQAKFDKARGEQKTVQEKYRGDREQRMLEIDNAFVPVIGGEKAEKKKEEPEDPDAIAIDMIRKTLKERKVTLEFTDADLRSVIIFLSRQSGINMMVDESIFETGAMTTPMAGGMPAAGMGGPGGAFPGGPGVEMPVVPVRTYSVTASLNNVSVNDALALILRSRGLDYEIYPNVIWISSQDRIASVPMEALEMKIFDLQFGGPFRGQIRPQPMQLETITFGESDSSSDGSDSSD